MRIKDERGYTLVETVIAVAVGLLVIAAIGSTLDAGTFSMSDNRSRLYATNALRQELETLRRADYATILVYAAAANGVTIFANDQVARLTNGAGSRTVVASFGADIKRVTLSVNWTGRRGGNLTQSVTTLISRRGLNGA